MTGVLHYVSGFASKKGTTLHMFYNSLFTYNHTIGHYIMSAIEESDIK